MGTHPYERLRTIVVTTPAGTTAAAPRSTTWLVGRGVIGHLDVVIPAGHVGLTGLAISWGGRQIIPYEGGEWITGNADEVQIVLELEVDSRLVVLTYNTDVFPHAHHLRAYVHDREKITGLFAPAPVFGSPSGEPRGGPFDVEDLTEEEDALVSAAGDRFLAELQDIFGSFLTDLAAMLGVAVPSGPEVPVPPGEEVVPGVMVPGVVGMSESAAAGALEALGLTWSSVELPSSANVGTVVAQDPPAGALVDPATTTVVLTVSVAIVPEAAPKTRVPDVVGKQRTEAAQVLRAKGFRVDVEETVDRHATRHQVVRQRPAAGTQRPQGSTVTITVAKRA